VAGVVPLAPVTVNV
jgi:hypothetical protein